jgi:hypothetical protein
MVASGNPNPVTTFKKGHKKVDGSGRQPGQPNYLTADIRKLIRQAAEETGFITQVPIFDAEGKPTGQFEEKMIEEGEKGYLKWLAKMHPQQFASLYGRMIPFEMNVKAEAPKRVVYPSLEDTRAALRANGIDPDVIERAMMPEFITDQRPVIDGEVVEDDAKAELKGIDDAS